MKFEKEMRVYIKGFRVLGIHENSEIICSWDDKNGTTQFLVPKEVLIPAGGPPAKGVR